MQCPICRKQIDSAANPFRPFCSERCKMIDLDNWLSGRYYIPAGAGGDTDDDDAAADEMKDAGDGLE